VSQNLVRIGVIGIGGVSHFQHEPGIRLDRRAKIVAICDASEQLCQQRVDQWGVKNYSTDYEELCNSSDIDAVIIATPNFLHRDIVLAAVAAGKHVFCEKPLALSAGDAEQMYRIAKERQVVHMTSFTYRFAPAMKYLRHLTQSGALGQPRHFRSQRFLDLPESSWGWRQYKDKAGAGDLYDMTIHRLDFAMDLLGPIARVTGALAHFADRDVTPGGDPCAPSDIDDWSCLIGQFRSGVVGVWEGTVVGKGYHHDGVGHEWAEVMGSEGVGVYRLHDPNNILLGKHHETMQPVAVPDEFLKPAASPRDPREGLPSTVFRYDMMWEFVSAIIEQREAVPSFYDGWQAQVVADAVIQSWDEKTWIEIPASVSQP
jgi:predicted dehydrogenase